MKSLAGSPTVTPLRHGDAGGLAQINKPSDLYAALAHNPTRPFHPFQSSRTIGFDLYQAPTLEEKSWPSRLSKRSSARSAAMNYARSYRLRIQQSTRWSSAENFHAALH